MCTILFVLLFVLFIVLLFVTFIVLFIVLLFVTFIVLFIVLLFCCNVKMLCSVMSYNVLFQCFISIINQQKVYIIIQFNSNNLFCKVKIISAELNK